MIMEQYKLILTHEMIDSENGTHHQIEEPYVLTYVVERTRGGGNAIFLNYMMDRFKYELLKMRGDSDD